jgi:hypothetical protein
MQEINGMIALKVFDKEEEMSKTRIMVLPLSSAPNQGESRDDGIFFPSRARSAAE